MLSRWTRYMPRLQQRVEVAFARLKHLHARQCKGDSALFPRRLSHKQLLLQGS